MKLNKQHFETIRELVVENDYPGERTSSNPEALEAFTRALNERTGLKASPQEVSETLEYIRKSKRQTGGLPRVGRHYEGPKITMN